LIQQVKGKSPQDTTWHGEPKSLQEVKEFLTLMKPNAGDALYLSKINFLTPICIHIYFSWERKQEE
jgi:hypothetical protein